MELLAPLIRQQKVCWAISGVAATHLTLVGLGLPGWQCPFRAGLGVPCPGCGLTRAVQALATGDWQQALTIHAFAPVAVGVMVLVIVASLLPAMGRQHLGNYLAQIERRSGITAILLVGFLFYWLIRLLFFTEKLYQLVM